jgi:alkylated DNA repair dioxygenase AlkB
MKLVTRALGAAATAASRARETYGPDLLQPHVHSLRHLLLPYNGDSEHTSNIWRQQPDEGEGPQPPLPELTVADCGQLRVWEETAVRPAATTTVVVVRVIIIISCNH